MLGQADLYFFAVFLLIKAKSVEDSALSLIKFSINSCFKFMDLNYAKFLLKQTKQDYDFIAQDFSRTRENPWPEIKFLFDKFLTIQEKVLDLGCGNGRYVPFFNEKKVDYLGVDNSEELIKIAQKKFPENVFEKQDAFNLSFPDNYFDKIYSIAVLHHIPSKELRIQFLKKVKRVLKPNGLIVLTVWKFWRTKEISLIFKNIILKLIKKSKLDYKDVFEPWGKKTKRYYHCFSKKELINLVKQAGFEVKQAGLIKNSKGNRRNIYIIAKK